MEADLAREIMIDLFRSAWIVEAARAEVFAGWAKTDARFAERAEWAVERAEITAGQLTGRGGSPDDELVGPHAAWMRNLAGDHPGEVPFAEVLLARLGDWVEHHAAVFYEAGEQRMKELGELERGSLELPSSLPEPEPFKPVVTPEVGAPGEVLFRFAILGDLHVGSTSGDDLVRAAVSEINRSGAELVVQLGDITDHGNPAEFESAVEILGAFEIPCYTMIGNHDIFSIAEETLAGRDHFTRHFGRSPDGVLAEHKGMRLAILDSAEHGASPFPPFDLLTGTFMEGPGGAIVRGSLTPPQHDLLAEIASPGAPPAFVFLHHPPQPYTGFPPVLFGLRDADTGRLHAVVDSGNVWGVFAGHTHRNARTRHFDGVPAQEVAIPRDFPCGYALVDVTDSGYAYRFLQIGDEELLRSAYGRAGVMWRRYALGEPSERAFTWTHSEG